MAIPVGRSRLFRASELFSPAQLARAGGYVLIRTCRCRLSWSLNGEASFSLTHVRLGVRAGLAPGNYLNHAETDITNGNDQQGISGGLRCVRPRDDKSWPWTGRCNFAVAEAGSFTHAGTRASQPVVSRQISALEIRWAFPFRHARGLIPTEQGELPTAP